jgi:hypothetical protein
LDSPQLCVQMEQPLKWSAQASIHTARQTCACSQTEGHCIARVQKEFSVQNLRGYSQCPTRHKREAPSPEDKHPQKRQEVRQTSPPPAHTHTHTHKIREWVWYRINGGKSRHRSSLGLTTHSEFTALIFHLAGVLPVFICHQLLMSWLPCSSDKSLIKNHPSSKRKWQPLPGASSLADPLSPTSDFCLGQWPVSKPPDH